MLKFSGVQTEDKGVKVEDHFDVVYEDAEVIMEGKKTFTHEEDGFNFDYKYMIRVIDMNEITGGETEGVHVDLEMVVSPSSLHAEQSYNVKYTVGMEDEEDYELEYKDVLEYGLGVSFGSEDYEQNVEEDYMESLEVQEGLRAIASVYESLDGMRGFLLDKPWNMIGTNGWDTLSSLVLNEELFKF